jgi:membrane fusion protein (multidrug efflux system)
MAIDFARTTRALEMERSTVGRLAVPAITLLLILWGAWFCLGAINVYDVSRQARIEVISAPRQLVAETAGRLVASQLRVGQTVAAGAVLARLDDRVEQIALAAAEARLAAQAARVTALDGELAALITAGRNHSAAAGAASVAAAARADAAQVRAGFDHDLAARQRQDAADGGLAAIEAQRAAANAQEAAANSAALAQQRRAAAANAGAVAADADAGLAAVRAALAEARGQWAASRQAVAQARRALALRVIRAPVAGVIGTVAGLRLGAMLPAGAVLASIVPAGRLQIVARFDAAHGLGRLDAGQRARLRLDGFAWAQYGAVPAVVEQVAAEPEAAGLRVELRLLPARGRMPRLRHGMSGQVDVLTEQVPPAVLLLRALGQWA